MTLATSFAYAFLGSLLGSWLTSGGAQHLRERLVRLRAQVALVQRRSALSEEEIEVRRPSPREGT